MALPLPEQPSIAVLPFANLSEDPKQELLCDGITDNIINALSKVPGLFVIARNSTLPYKSKPVKARQVSEELGVRYVLDGSVQWSGDRVRITAQMVDAITGKQLLSERYEGETSKVFAAQDDIAMKVLGSIMKLTNQTVGTEWTKYSKDPHGLDCFLKFQEGVRFLNRMTLAGAKQTQQIVEEGLAMCPENPSLYRLLAAAYINYYFYDSSRPPRESIEKATELLQKTLSLDSNNAFAHGSLSIVYLQKREYDKAIAEGELSASLDPGSPMTAFCYAKALVYGGRSEEAIPLLEKAIRLNPLAPAVYYNDLGHALRMTGRLEEAAAEYKKSIKIAPNDFWIHAALAVVYIMMGRDEEAHAEAAETLRINPKFTLELYAKRSLFKDQSVVEGNIDVMRKAGLPDKPPLPLPDKPSIAVLPFTNLSDDKSQEYFSDGLTEEIITALSKTPKLFVIARNSSFVYKGKPVNVQQASRELGVKYVLEGTVRRSGDQLRITTQLIDAISGNHLWAEQYDRELKDIFAIQDDVTMKILTSLQVTLTEGESARFLERGTDNLEAYLKTMEGREFLGRLNKDDNAIAQRKFKEAISLDPKFARPYAGLSICYTMDFSFQIDPQESLRKAYEYAQKAIAIDETQLLAHGALEFVYGWKRQYEMAIASGERAVQVAPGCADAYFYLGRALSYACRDREAIGYFDKAIRMNPFPPSFYYMHLGMAHFNLRQYEQAVLDLKKALTLSPKNQPARRALIGTYIEMGRLEEAKAEGVEVLKIEPNYTSKGIEKILPFRDQEVRKRWADALRLVGLERDVSAQ
jgi:TolB-like protein/Flp pilus assembly protein TadD